MPKYDVYGIGNALVDIEYHAEPARLHELGVDKGVMTLIDETRQNTLIARLGESHEKMACGGSAANTIIAVTQLGGRAHFDCRVSSDMTGQFFARDLHEWEVNSNLDFKPLPPGVTGKCLVFVTPDADRSMNTFLGVTAELDVGDIDRDAIADSRYVYIEGYLAGAEKPRDAAVEVRRVAEQHGVATSLTISDLNMVRFFRDSLDAMIGDGVDLLFANEEEALELADVDELGQAVEYLRGRARRFAITRGNQGALLYDGSTTIDIAAHKVEAIDTLGAGDLFAGAFLYSLCQGMDFSAAGALASAVSAKIVTQFGPRLQGAQAQAVLRDFMIGR